MFVVKKSLKGVDWNKVGPASQTWRSITSALGQCIVLSGVSDGGMENVPRIMQQSESRVISPML